MRKASLLLLVLLALGAWAVAQSTPQALQITHGPIVEQVTSNSAIVAWTTNVPSSAIVHYGQSNDPSKLTQTAEEAWGGQQAAGKTTHRVTIQNLQPNTLYFLQVESGQGQGTGTGQKSSLMAIQTTAPGAPPIAYPHGH